MTDHTHDGHNGMTMDIAKLKGLLAAATPGPWEAAARAADELVAKWRKDAEDAFNSARWGDASPQAIDTPPKEQQP